MATRRLATRLGGPLLALASGFATLLVLEAGLRVQAVRRHGAALDEATATRPRPGARVALGDIVQPSRHRRIVYELKPHLDVRFREVHLTTDARGFRRTGASTAEAPANVRPFRIVGLGDSYMFGWGVADEQTYLARLEARLRAHGGSRSWQVVNTAVPGYNTAMEVETLVRKALDPSPQLVVLEVVGNDLDLPNFIQTSPPVWSTRRSLLAELVTRRVRALRGDAPPPAEAPPLAQAPSAAQASQLHFEDDPARVPPAYADLVGWGAFERALRELGRLRDEHGFSVVVVSEAPGFDWFEHRSRRLARQLGFAYLDVGRTIDRRVAAEGFRDYLDSPLALDPADPHPSAAGHELAGDELFRFVTRSGLVELDGPGP